MNIDKILIALEEDRMNSALGVICSELEKQGYKVKIEDIEVSSDEIFNGRASYLEEYPGIYRFEIESADGGKQKFSIKFIDYHRFILCD